MAFGFYNEIGVEAMRISRLLPNGRPDYGNAKGSILMRCNGKLKITPNVNTGTNLTKQGSCPGQLCLDVEVPDTITGYKGRLEVCETSDELEELLAMAAPIMTGVNQIGGAYYPQLGCGTATTTSPGVIIEAWTKAYRCKSQVVDAAGLLLRRRIVIALAYGFLQDGDSNYDETVPTYAWTFRMLPNANVGTGPNKDLAAAVGALAPGWTHTKLWDALPLPVIPPNSVYTALIP